MLDVVIEQPLRRLDADLIQRAPYLSAHAAMVHVTPEGEAGMVPLVLVVAPRDHNDDAALVSHAAAHLRQ